MHFIDTNILLYSVAAGSAEESKASIAADILRREDLCLSVQVLQEFYYQATHVRRTKRLTHASAVALIGTWKRYPVQDVTVELLDRALATKERWGLSCWDATIIAAARMQGCDEVFSEDMADDQDYGGVRVVNPFHSGKMPKRR